MVMMTMMMMIMMMIMMMMMMMMVMTVTVIMMIMGVGVGYHHPPTQWPNTPVGARQGGNSAPVACPTRLASWKFCFLGVSVVGHTN
eukprot:12412387-Karenia_brevis.AAC.1